MRLLDQILLAAVRWRLAGFRRVKFASGLTKLLSAEFERQERADRETQQAAAERARIAAAVEQFTNFEPGKTEGLRLQ
jgi:hypothetical protein